MGRKKKAEERNSTSTGGAVAHQQAHLHDPSRSPSPGKEGNDVTGGVKAVAESAEKKKKRNWLKRIFSKGSKDKDSDMRKSASAHDALDSLTKSKESVLSDENNDGSGEESGEETEGDGHASNQAMTRQTSSPAYLGGFRKRPVTVELGDDVWAQVKAKQEAMFQDKRLLKVDPEISSSFMLTPNSDNEQQAEKNEENVQPAKVDTLKPLDVSDDEWARVRAAQEKLFDSTADDRNNDENTESVSSGTRKVSEVLTSLVEESRHKQPSAARFSSAEKVKAALAKKEEQSDVKEEPIKLEATKETTESDDPIDVDLDAHEFFVDIENHEFFADLGDKGEGTTSPTTDTSERDMSTPDIVVSESVEDKKPPSPLKTKVTQTDTETPQPSLKDLVRQRSLKLRSDREHKRYTVASPLFLEGEQELWELVQSQHHALIGDLGTKPVPDRLDGLKADILDSSPEEVRPESKILKHSGLTVAEKPTEEQTSVVTSRLEQRSENDEGKVDINSKNMPTDLSVVPVIQPSLGLMAGHIKRNLSRKNRRRPPSVRVPIVENQTLFETVEPRARSNSTGGADEATKTQAAKAVEISSAKSLQRARTVAGRGKRGALSLAIPEQNTPELKDKQPSWLKELEKKTKTKQETSNSTNPLYKTKKEVMSPTKEISTASLVAEAAKKKTAQEKRASFKQPKTVTNGRPQSMFVSPSGSSEPPWVVHAQKKSGGNVSPLAKSPGKNLNKPNWVVKAQKMQSQEKEQAKTPTSPASPVTPVTPVTPVSPLSGTSKLQASPVKQSSIEERIKSLRQASNAAT